MNDKLANIINNSGVIGWLRTAWFESNPGSVGGHEEGGFISCDHLGALAVHRWPRYSPNRIVPIAHDKCQIGNRSIILSFHTHPHTGRDYEQEPSATDCSVVLNDPDLKGVDYLGELVIANDLIYLIQQSGDFLVVGRTSDILQLPSGES